MDETKRISLRRQIRMGLEGRSLSHVLLLYIVGLLVLGPIGLLVTQSFGLSVLLRALPFLVLALVSAEYAIAWSNPEVHGPTQRSTPTVEDEAGLVDSSGESTKPSTLTGASIALLYGFPGRFVIKKSPTSPTQFVELPSDPPPGHNPQVPTEVRLARDFKALGTIHLGSKSEIQRYWHKAEDLKIKFEGCDYEIVCKVLATFYKNYEVASLLINVYTEDIVVDDLIAICHSAEGKNEEARAEIKANRRKEERAERKLIVHVGSAESDSVRCAAWMFMQRFIREYLDEHPDNQASKEQEQDPQTSREQPPKDADFKTWSQSRFGEPTYCIELKRPLPEDNAENAASIDSEDAKTYIRQGPARAIYGLLVGDEGWQFVPADVAVERIKAEWRTRNFFSVMARGHGIVLLNFRCKEYEQFQEKRWPKYFGYENEFFRLDSEIAGLEHGPLIVLESCLVSQALLQDSQNRIREHQDPAQQYHSKGLFRGRTRTFSKERNQLFALRMGLVGNIRQLSELRVPEIGELGQMLRREQRIDAEVEEVKSWLAEVDAELRILQQDAIDGLVVRLTWIAVVIGLVAMILAVPVCWDAVRSLLDPPAR